MEGTHRKRLLSLDTSRGFYTCVIIIAHAFSHLMFWDMSLIALEDFSIVAIIILSPIIIIATCAPVFVQISASALSYNFYLDVQKFIQSQKEIHTLSENPTSISFRNPMLLRIIKKNLINYAVLLGASLLHVFLFHYGLHWNGTVQHTILTGIIETGKILPINYEVFFQTDAIGLIAMSGIFNVGLISLLLCKEGFYKPKRNLIILFGLVFGWFILSPILHLIFDDLFWESLNAGQYGITLLLKLIVGPPQSIFPNFAFGFVGIIYGFAFAQGENYVFFKKTCGILAIIFLGAAGIVVLLNGFSLSPDSFGLFLPLEIQLLDFAVIQILTLLFIKKIEFSSTSPEILRKKTRIFRQYGSVTMTVYMFESVLCLLNMLWFIPLWKLLPQTSFILHLEVFTFVAMQLALWYGITTLWKRSKYKFSVEWFTVLIRKKILKN
ncbi:hypothetical protein [Candidatus Lokiarchaeum ossiferum]|uniref:hypothetical protein n=1 Tax=Candidatus Lokiarchaeum ossiferum TaxID=2951803 RepID=UPI00352C4548